ncbi:sodium:solute symporter family protein [candidate division KSB1 bacterium]|nr:sodium:solute symporter family protein [candidate division KSB1 bacterium]
MHWYLYVILAYILVLMGFNFYRSKKVKTQEDFMVAGRSLSVRVMVFTLICTWIGSGTFIAGAEYAYKAGFSSLWMPAGAWVGIIIIYFLAGKIRTFGQYTIGDILEVRYGKTARVFGAIALIISFTAIVSYQFRAGGYILNVVTDGAVSVEVGQFLAAAFVILFTALAGMMAVAYTDLPNGIIIVLACVISTPFVYFFAGGLSSAQQVLPPDHFTVFSETFGAHPVLKGISYFLATGLLLMGVQSMYQKFYSAKTAKGARQAVVLWVIGTIVVETVVVIIAVFASSHFWGQGYDPAAMVILAAKHMVHPVVGILLLGAACAVVISTGMNYLLSPTTNLMRDVYQRFIRPDADQRTMVALQKVVVVVLGVIAFFLATKLVSVLEMSYFAYTIYGVAITPALIAALTWKRATKAGGLASIISGTVVCVFLKVITYILPPEQVPDGDPWGIPIIYPSLIVSLLCLFVVSYLTQAPKEEEIKELFQPSEA